VSATAEWLDVHLLIDGSWRGGRAGRTLPLINPATDRAIGRVAVAEDYDVQEAVVAAGHGFQHWRSVPAHERAQVLRRAAENLRDRTDAIAAILTTEQGKPLSQARAELNSATDTIEWFAEEARRCFGQLIPGRTAHAHVLTRLEPVGPVAAFTPWNFPVSQSVKKVAAALAAGCSIVLKGPEETPAACAAMVRAFVDAGLPAGALALLYGDPARISELLVPHPGIRKVTFTGSVTVGKLLAGLAGSHMKRVTMELGGHAPAIVCEDADLELASRELARMKFMNAGQVCLAPTRFLVARPVCQEFIERLREQAATLVVDHGFAPGVAMGPLVHQRRVQAMEGYVADAVRAGAKVACGGQRLERAGSFYAPSVLYDVPTVARAMNEEPFGPLALVCPFDTLEQALTEANRLAYGLAAYVFTRSIKSEAQATERLEAGMIAVNRVFSSMIEAPFGGVKDSGYGTEGGTRAIFNFLNEKMITRFVG
jgi:succinate-semialdehyde dehydrogenase / glutarate-semialdehyde dehydrogenase